MKIPPYKKWFQCGKNSFHSISKTEVFRYVCNSCEAAKLHQPQAARNFVTFKKYICALWNISCSVALNHQVYHLSNCLLRFSKNLAARTPKSLMGMETIIKLSELENAKLLTVCFFQTKRKRAVKSNNVLDGVALWLLLFSMAECHSTLQKMFQTLKKNQDAMTAILNRI